MLTEVARKRIRFCPFIREGPGLGQVLGQPGLDLILRLPNVRFITNLTFILIHCAGSITVARENTLPIDHGTCIAITGVLRVEGRSDVSIYFFGKISVEEFPQIRKSLIRHSEP